MTLTFTFYWHAGHFDEAYNAVVTSNFRRMYPDPYLGIKYVATLLGSLFVFAALG